MKTCKSYECASVTVQWEFSHLTPKDMASDQALLLCLCLPRLLGLPLVPPIAQLSSFHLSREPRWYSLQDSASQVIEHSPEAKRMDPK